MKKRLSAVVIAAAMMIALAAAFLVSPVAAYASGITGPAIYSSKSKVQVYNGDSLVESWDYDTPDQAWAQINKINGGKVAGLPTGGNVTVKLVLGGHWTRSDQLVINQSVTIDLNGCAIIRDRGWKKTGSGGVILVTRDATLTVEDSQPDSVGYDGVPGGVITGGASTSGAGGIHLQPYAKLVFNGGTIYDCSTSKDGGAIYADENSTLLMDGGRIYYCRTADSTVDCDGGAIYMEDYTYVEIKNSVIDNCCSEDYGGAIYSDGGRLFLDNVLFTGNSALDNGGAINMQDEMTSLRIENCTFSGNSASGSGGAIYINDNLANDNPLMIRDCLFNNNRAGNKGGAICVNDYAIVLVDTKITGNRSTYEGGGVYVDSMADISVKGLVEIRDNKSEKRPGKNNLTLQDGTASQAYIFNGGLYEGSYIGLSSTSGGKIMVSMESFTPDQLQKYLYADQGSLKMGDAKTVSTPLITGSLLGDRGSTLIVGLLLTAASLIAIASLIIARKFRAKGETTDDED